jgi:hypothetical protein
MINKEKGFEIKIYGDIYEKYFCYSIDPCFRRDDENLKEVFP